MRRVCREEIASRADIRASVPEKIIVNCIGLGSMTLFSDTKMTPIKGQLAMLPPQAALQYLYGRNGYLFPRSDHVVIGGNFEVGVNNETPDRALCRSLVDHIRAQFGKGPAKPMPDLHIHHPDHALIVNPAPVA